MLGPLIIAVVVQIAQIGLTAAGTDVTAGRQGFDASALTDGFVRLSRVIGPEVLEEVKPEYTVDAMKARIEGVVGVEAVVLPDGSVGVVRVVKSLDKEHGLDGQAIKAVKQWRFRPGKRLGRAVPVIVSIELTFRLRDKRLD
jgi:TonB family protein